MHRFRNASGAAALLAGLIGEAASPVAAVASPAVAASVPATPAPPSSPLPDIVVTAPSVRGAVKGDIPPEIELGETAVASYGAATIAELLDALTPETGTGRGRGSGGPVILLNGRRIASFAEIRDLPTEAIERVQILPEEVALKFGYNADQRVVNFILKDNFRAETALSRFNASTEGARFEPQEEATFTKLGKTGRINLSAAYTHDAPVREDQRGIVERTQAVPASLSGNVIGLPPGSSIDPGLNALFGAPVTSAALPVLASGQFPTLAALLPTANQPSSTDIGSFKTLLGASDDFKLNGTVNRALTPTISVTVNATYELNLTRSLLGLPSTLLTVAPGQPFSPFSDTVGVSRAFTPALTRDVRSNTYHGAVTLDGDLRQWQWTVTGTYDRSLVNTATGRGRRHPRAAGAGQRRRDQPVRPAAAGYATAGYCPQRGRHRRDHRDRVGAAVPATRRGDARDAARRRRDHNQPRRFGSGGCRDGGKPRAERGQRQVEPRPAAREPQEQRAGRAR